MQYSDFIAQNTPLEGVVSQLGSIIPYYSTAFTVNAVIIVFLGNKTGLDPRENAVYSRLLVAHAIAGAATTATSLSPSVLCTYSRISSPSPC